MILDYLLNLTRNRRSGIRGLLGMAASLLGVGAAEGRVQFHPPAAASACSA